MEMIKGLEYIGRALENPSKIEVGEFELFYNCLRDTDCLVLVGEGRSQTALYITMESVNKHVHAIRSLDFHGKDITELAPVLEKEHDKITFLVNSGSGETSIPKRIVQQLSDYIEREKSNQFTINAVVSNKNSSIGKIGEKGYGNVIELQGREEKSNSNNGDDNYSKDGMMNDVYELGSLLLFQKTREALNERKDYMAVFKKMEEESEIISEIVKNFTHCGFYKGIIDKLETRIHITMGGLGPSRNVARMTAIRLQHAKRALGDGVYLSGPFAPRLRAGDILFIISESGETEPPLKWCKDHKESGGYVYSLVGNESTLSRESDSFIIESTLTNFYERATFALSPLPLHLVNRIKQRGLNLPEYIIKWFQHSVTE